MESEMPALPTKLRKDSIAEALCEVRFQCEESASLPEIVVARLAEFQEWKEFQKIRLSISDIPAAIRAQDPNLRNQPLLELRELGGSRSAKIGANVLSYHRLAPYPGWAAFKPEIDRTIAFLFHSFQPLTATRLGFRYVNAFTIEDHGINHVGDLNYSVNLGGNTLGEPQNLNYRLKRSDNHIVQVRIASPEFISGSLERRVQVLVDLDVFTPSGFATNQDGFVKDWMENAHIYEKEEFFRLFTEEMKKRLIVEPG
jgi:uncharacterized protein (TIGR04255 family)